ncbi:glycosyl transferase, family 39 [Mycobacteroides abscessus subsp. bolletii]|uniref:ArnT family glycosyltransferase n=1 Tax=Mycobacteroides abscessus TaxID=36809 RepID=UPI0009A66411|nr:glycosyltransferase family 39 protein [Mycobacteroides abscessus]SLF57826.1 glycosyl transferase, family 39 [Mycobacteroides abscessus subsp. bolletii]
MPTNLKRFVSSSAQGQQDELPPFAAWAVGAVALTAGIVATLSATRYGYYYDELYFIAAGKRPSFSYADQGPLVPLLAISMDWLFPGSFAALRIPGVIAELVVVVVSALIARELGGGRGAQVLAAIACATAFGILGETESLITNAIDTALWALLSWLVIRWVRTRHDTLLLTAGLVTIVALQVKWLVPVFWIAILIAAGCVGPRELLRRPALWCSAAATAVSVIPALIWQARHGWPQAGMGAVVRGQTDMLFGPLTFIPRAIQMCGVLGAVLLVYGLWSLWRSPQLRPYRFVGLAFLIVVAIFAIAGGRVQYGIGLYAAVIAAGAVELAALQSTWTRVAAVPVIAVSIVTFVVYGTQWRSVVQLTPASDFAAGLAGHPYGEFGWTELTATVADAYHGLPADQQHSAVIITERYIQAAALDYYQSTAGLPDIYSPKRGYGYFGTPPDNATTVLWVGSNKTDLQTWFTSVVPVTKFGVRLGMPQVTRDITIWKCAGPRKPWSSMWPTMQSL